MRLKRALPPVARWLSNLVSPPVVTAVFGFVIAWQDHASWLGMLRALLYGALTCLLPVLLVLYLLKTGRIKDLHMSNAPEQRRIPYLASFLCAAAAFLLFHSLGDAPMLSALAACNVLGLAALGLINNFWLVSNHTASVSMVAAFSACLFGWHTVLWSLPLVGLVTWARWLLRKHTLAQLAAGFAVGVAPVLLFAGLGWRLPWPAL